MSRNLLGLGALAPLALVATANATTYTGAGGTIPDSQPTTGLMSTITVDDDFIVDDITITLNGLVHTWIGDLTATVMHVESGATQTLFVQVGLDNDSSNLGGDYSFNDAFTGDLWAAAASGGSTFVVPSGNYFATGALSAAKVNLLPVFAGLSAKGAWKLTITDSAAQDFGTLGGWTLGFVKTPIVTCNECCPADLNLDGMVDSADLGLLLSCWGPIVLEACACADFDSSGSVDSADLGSLLVAWGDCPIATECACAVADHGCCDQGGPGCTDALCCETVCEADSSCCLVAWDATCVGAANLLCDPCPSDPACGEAGHDCFTTGGPFCDNLACCESVCVIVPSCCEASWDVMCVNAAFEFCTQPGFNDFCQDAFLIGAGHTSFSTVGATTDGPVLPPTCERGFGLNFVNDIWYVFTAPMGGPLRVSTCNQATYDTRLAVYAGHECFGDLLACNDDFAGCGLTSCVDVDVVAGQQITIRVGGYSGSGTGTLEVAYGPCP